MAVRTQYPIDEDKLIVRGDPLAVPIEINRRIDGVVAPIDITGWAWRAHIRRSPDAALIMEFDIDMIARDDDDYPSVVVLRLTPDQTRLLRTGYVFDLEQLVDHATPTSVRTWWICTKLRVTKDVSYA